MRGSPVSSRLGLALLFSLLLHAALLLSGPAPAPPSGVSPQTAVAVTVFRTALQPSPAPNAAHPGSQATPGPASQPRAHSRPDARGHYHPEQLSRQPHLLKNPELDLPEAQLLTGPGRLLLSLWIDTNGRVVAYEIEAPDLPEEYTTAVAEAFSAQRYAPGELGGRKVPSILKLEIQHGPAGDR